jgi:hypothetical protein
MVSDTEQTVLSCATHRPMSLFRWIVLRVSRSSFQTAGTCRSGAEPHPELWGVERVDGPGYVHVLGPPDYFAIIGLGPLLDDLPLPFDRGRFLS